MHIQASPTPSVARRPEKNSTFAGAYHTSTIDGSFLRSLSCMQEVDPSHTNMVMEVYRDGAQRDPDRNTISRAQQRNWRATAAISSSLTVGGPRA